MHFRKWMNSNVVEAIAQNYAYCSVKGSSMIFKDKISFLSISIYIKLKSCPSVHLSVRHADNSPGSAYSDLSTAYHHKPIILLLQVCHCEWMQWSDCVLQQAEDEEVEKTRATFHRKPQPYGSIGSATDLHWGGRRFESRWWTAFFFSQYQYFCKHVF